MRLIEFDVVIDSKGTFANINPAYVTAVVPDQVMCYVEVRPATEVKPATLDRKPRPSAKVVFANGGHFQVVGYQGSLHYEVDMIVDETVRALLGVDE